jgi:hypothetical protein
MTTPMTEAEAMEKLMGKPVMVEVLTAVGSETVLGSVITPLLIENEEVTHVTVQGSVIGERITGLPIPVENREGVPVTLELVPIAEIEPL